VLKERAVSLTGQIAGGVTDSSRCHEASTVQCDFDALDPPDRLTNREPEVLPLMAGGYSDSEIAGASSCLLASPFWTGGEHRNAFDPDFPLAVHVRRGHGVQGLALRSADRDADEAA
jgi:hypothetical protein